MCISLYFILLSVFPPSAPRQPVNMRTIHPKLSNEKADEASLTERRLCEEGGRARWPLANRLKCNLHSCGWISDVGVLRKGIWLPEERHDIQSASWPVYARTCADTDTRAGREGDEEQRQSSVWFNRWLAGHPSPSLPEPDTVHSTGGAQVCVLSLLCDSPRCRRVRLPRRCPLAQQLWYQAQDAPHPGDASGTKHGEEEVKGRGQRCVRVDAGCHQGITATGMPAGLRVEATIQCLHTHWLLIYCFIFRSDFFFTQTM